MKFSQLFTLLNKNFERYLNNRIVCAVILFLISFSIFIPSLKNDFVWDDIPYILQRIKYLVIEEQVSTLIPSESKSKNKYFRPTLHISLALDNEIWKGSAFGFHLSNILYHSLSTVVAYLLFFIILGKFGISGKEHISFFGSLLFALHPVHVESVSFIMARSDLLCSLFLLSSFIFYVKSYEHNKYYNSILLILSGALFYLGLLSKEVAYIFPIIILIFDLVSPKKKIRQYVYRYMLVGIISLLYFYFRIKAFVIIPKLSSNLFTGGESNVSTLSTIFINSLNAYGYYIYKLIFPFYFNASPGRLTADIFFILIAISVLPILIILITRFRKKCERLMLFLLSWTILSVTPAVIVLFFDIVTSPYAERFLYIPSAGYCLLLAYSLYIFSYEKQKKGKIFYVVAALICLVYSTFTFKEQSNWKNNLSLWKVTSERSPDLMMPHLNYGFSLLESGQTDLAIIELSKSLEYEAGSHEADKATAANNIGNAYINKRDYQQAKKYFKIALKYSPKKYRATYYYHMGLIDYLKGNEIYFKDGAEALSLYKRALENLNKSLKIAPDFAQLNLLMAEVYLKLGKIDKAKRRAKKALKRYHGVLSDDMIERAIQISEMTAVR